MRPVEEVKDKATGIKCVQQGKGEGADARDDCTIENDPGAFAAEQTWPTEQEIKNAKRKLSGQDEMVEMDTGDQPAIGGFKIEKKNGDDLANLFEKMQIAVVGRENQDEDSDRISDGESGDEVGDLEDELRYQQDDANVTSLRHLKHTNMEERAKEDMDFPDEVETPLKEARIRFQKYRGIKSLKNCDWDPYENLPEHYAKIWRF